MWKHLLRLSYRFPDTFTKINQIELNAEYAFVSCTIPESIGCPTIRFIGVDRNTTGHIAVAADLTTGKIEKLGKSALHPPRRYAALRRRLQKEGKFRIQKSVNKKWSIISRKRWI